MLSVAIHDRGTSPPRAQWCARLALLAVLLNCTAHRPARSAEARLPEFSSADRAYWAWQPIQRPASMEEIDLKVHPVDSFLLPGSTSAYRQEADRRTLVRRATFDLHGLPPTPQEVADFVADKEPLAYERLVDRLLASPRYGEHWARYWLDLVRFAESDGFKSDDIRPNAWRYRDYVIRAFNDDKPYDRFVSEQLAGDELAPDDLEARVATGFLRLGPYEENARDVLDQRSNVLNDVTDVTGQVFLGLTFACARCHDHKYDPILQADYFRLQAFFAGLAFTDDQPLATAAAQAEHDEQMRKWEEATTEPRRQLAEIEAPYRAQLRADKRTVFPDYVQVMLDTPAERRSPLERQMAELAERQLHLQSEEVLKKMSPADRERAQELARRLADPSQVARPAPLPRAMLAHDSGPIPPATMIPNQERVITPGFLSILDPGPAAVASPSDRSSGRRAALARWIADPQNPLTARVIVNRIFEQHFGRGIVATSQDFGRQGARPSDPALLDFLSADFIAGGFRLKALHRLLMTSAAYRQRNQTAGGNQASASAESATWWKTAKRRLTGEQLRDAMLAVSGELNLQMEGPSIRGELPPGISVAYAWEPDPDAAQRNRRAIYMFARRNLTDPLLDAFDRPDSHEPCTRRQETTTAPQALTLLNGTWTLDRARALADRVLQMASGEKQRVVDAAYQATYQRDPTAAERAAADNFLSDQAEFVAQRLKADAEQATRLALPTGTPTDSADKAWRAALVDFCHVLLNTNEFLYLD